MSVIVLGVEGMHEQPVSYGWDPTTGPFTVRSWHGQETFAASLTAQLRAAGLQYEVENGPGKTAKVRARVSKDEDGSEEQPINNWEVGVNRVEQSLYKFYKVQNLGQTKVGELKQAVEETDPSDLDPNGDQPTAYNHFIFGTDSTIVEQSVIRHTQTVSQSYSRTIAQSNVGKIFTPAQMLSLAGAPSNVLGTAETAPDTTAYGFTTIFGYRKAKPTMSQQAGNKWQIVTEYEEGLWSLWLHEAAS